MDTVDIIIVGAGSAGCAAAGRLAATGRYRILVLEAGPPDSNPWIHLPIGYGKTFYDPHVNWMYLSEPVAGLDGRTLYQPRGKVVGGSSSINAMVYARGQAEDFDGWAALGNHGWSWADVLALYRRMEDHALGCSQWHGAGGPLHVTDISDTIHPLTRRFLQAATEAGLAFNPDLNGAGTEGVGTYQITTRGGRRESAARAYLRPALRTGHVRLETTALATRIVFQGRRAVGVEYRQRGRTRVCHAAHEIVLSGGAINTPQLLQVSGVGPAGLLTQNGVAVVADIAAVGRHLQDHLCYDHIYRSREPSLNEDLLSLTGRLRVGLAYALRRSGPLAITINQAGGFMRSRPEFDRPDLQLYFQPLTYENAVPGVRALMKPDPFPGFSTSVSPCRPRSRGHVAIRSPDPLMAPMIAPNFLDAPEDVAAMLTGARFLRRLAQTPTLAALIDAELRPGERCRSDDDLIADIRQRAYSVFHPCGTCRMGPDPLAAVVDPALRVHGLAHLRIADASIFPTVPSGNINAPAIMVGEKAADLIASGA